MIKTTSALLSIGLLLAGANALADDMTKKDAMAKDGMKQPTATKDAMAKDGMKKAATKKDTMAKDGMKKDEMKK